MKKIIYSLVFVLTLSLTGCLVVRSSGNSGNLPPGQAKKVAGSHSAKPFAPGQRKKK